MLIAQKLIRRDIALVVAGVPYDVVQRVLSMLGAGVSAISPIVFTLSTAFLATAVGVRARGCSHRTSKFPPRTAGTPVQLIDWEDKIMAPSADRWGRVLAVCAFAVSLLSLAVSIFSSRETTEHDKVSVAPYLMFTTISSKRNDADIGLTLENVGSGPAVIKGMRFYVDGHALDNVKGLGPYLNEHRNSPYHGDASFDEAFMPKGAVLGASKAYYLLRINAPKDEDQDSDKGDAFLNHRLFVIVEYESVYGDPSVTCSGNDKSTGDAKHDCGDYEKMLLAKGGEKPAAKS